MNSEDCEDFEDCGGIEDGEDFENADWLRLCTKQTGR